MNQFKLNLQQTLTQHPIIPPLAPSFDLNYANFPHHDELQSVSPASYHTDHDGRSQEGLSESSKKIRKNPVRKEKYNIISNEVRLELIDAVINRGEKMKQAASRLGVNYSSAKSIFQVYKREGRFDKKSSKNLKPAQRKPNKDLDSNEKVSKTHNGSSETTFESGKDLSDVSSTKENVKPPLDLDSVELKGMSGTPSTCSSNALLYSRISSGSSDFNQNQSPQKTSLFTNKSAFHPFSTQKVLESSILPTSWRCLGENRQNLSPSLLSQLNELNQLLIVNRNQRMELLQEQQKQLSLLKFGLETGHDLLNPLNYLAPQQTLLSVRGFQPCYKECGTYIPPFDSKMFL